MSYGQGSVILKQKLPASSPVTAGARNGLTITSGYVELGGTLIQSTYIRTEGYYFAVGDLDSIGNTSSLIIDDPNKQILFNLSAGTRFLIDTAANTYKFGDISGLFNSSKIVIDDSTANKSITNTAATKHIWQVGTAGATEAMRIASTANLLLGTTVDSGYKLDASGVVRFNYNGYGLILTNSTTFGIKWINSGTDTWAIAGGGLQGGELTNSFNFYNFQNSNTKVSISSDGIFMINVPYPISSNYAASAQLQVYSTTKGFLPPRMTSTQKTSISSPAAGLIVYDTTLNKLCVYTTAWETITSV